MLAPTTRTWLIIYCNLNLENDVLTTNVKGVHISLYVQELGECLEIHFEGAKIRSNYDAQLKD